MPQRRILFIDSTSLLAFLVSGGAVQLEGRFTATPEGIESFSSYIGENHHSIFSLLVDVPEEGFQIEEIPHCSGKDRTALISRKLAQTFYGSPYSVASTQGRLKTGRRDERLLLMALTRPQQIDAWFETLNQHQVTLAGLYVLPQLVAHLLPKTAIGPQLFITQTQSGLRQTFFQDRQLRFSRLTPLLTHAAEEVAVTAALEASKMHQYLAGQRLIERNRPLETYVLAHPTHMHALRSHCRDSAILHFEITDLVQEATRIGLRVPLANSHAEMLFCYLLAHQTPRDQFAPRQAREYYRLWQTRFGIKSTAAFILACGLLFAFKQEADIMALHERTNIAMTQAHTDQMRYDAVMQALPKTDLILDDLRAFVSRYDQVDKRAAGPAPLLAQLSQSLDAFPAISIDQIDWLIAEELVPVVPGINNPKDAPPPPPEMNSGPYAHALVNARMPASMAGDQRGQIKLVADFVKHLGAAANTLVTIITPPVDTQSGKTLKSGDDTRIAEPPRFVFRLTRKL